MAGGIRRHIGNEGMAMRIDRDGGIRGQNVVRGRDTLGDGPALPTVPGPGHIWRPPPGGCAAERLLKRDDDLPRIEGIHRDGGFMMPVSRLPGQRYHARTRRPGQQARLLGSYRPRGPPKHARDRRSQNSSSEFAREHLLTSHGRGP